MKPRILRSPESPARNKAPLQNAKPKQARENPDQRNYQAKYLRALDRALHEANIVNTPLRARLRKAALDCAAVEFRISHSSERHTLQAIHQREAAWKPIQQIAYQLPSKQGIRFVELLTQYINKTVKSA